ncbi:hypothetical protein BDM02DRAFT_3153006 [Thelephora ganbajun]|uniref:Uncharacterized protein n=1 Tax=Thelephora ganbajun TaxID=370292 RepID=A0ACB6ZVH8_THEGA|nr:hypothetical protein BDM02DRAFT_3153006 [Thelephora ganbajun]
MDGYLAYVSKRSLVFNNYTWNTGPIPYSHWKTNIIPSRIPMSALIEGPLAGGPFPQGDDAPRAVMKDYFDQVCPKTLALDHRALLSRLPPDYTGGALVDAWVELLSSTSERCVEITKVVFNIRLMGSERLLDVMPDLLKSPIVTKFRWSPLVEGILHQNFEHFAPDGLPYTSADNNPYPTIEGLLVMHIRRGDFEKHCKHLAEVNTTFTAFNQIQGITDRFAVLPRGPKGHLTNEGARAYQKACYPTMQDIVRRVGEIRASESGKKLRRIYIMTNGKREWVVKLKEAFLAADHWDDIASSRDLELNDEQRYVAQAADMLIGQRADVFIGNGFSSLTANVAMLRMARNLGGDRTRYWL